MKAPKDRQDFELEEKSIKDFELAEIMEKLQSSMGGMGGGMGELRCCRWDSGAEEQRGRARSDATPIVRGGVKYSLSSSFPT